mgnify:CR=1 FL=1
MRHSWTNTGTVVIKIIILAEAVFTPEQGEQYVNGHAPLKLARRDTRAEE